MSSARETYYRLERYPDVCRNCLKPGEDTGGFMISLETRDELFEGSIGEFIETITLAINKDKSHLYPQAICESCLETLKFFARYRSKLLAIHRLMYAMVELKHSNVKPLMDLFEAGAPAADSMNTIFRDLDLCRSKGSSPPQAKHLIADFRRYEIASLPNVLIAEDSKPEIPEYFDGKASVEGDDEAVVEIKVECDVVEDPDRGEGVDGEGSSDSEAGGDLEDEFRGEIIQCTKCGYLTRDQALYEAHQRSHFRRETGTYPCRDCSEVFPNLQAIKKHRPQAHKGYVCDVCGVSTSEKSKLAAHVERYHTSGEYPCEFCQKSFKVEKDRYVHVKRVHEKQKVMWRCDTCGLEFKRKSTLNVHEVSHQNVFEHLCTQCASKFKTLSGLNRHIQMVHREKTRPCPHCDKKYHEKYQLLDHIEFNHGIQMRFFCDVCVEWFEGEDKLAVHAERHRNPKELECPTCLVVFPAQEQLDDHLCITYRDDYVCCGEDFKFHKFYNNHMVVKHGTRTNVRVRIKPGQLFGAMRRKRKRLPTCPKCDATFPSSAKKLEHVEICQAEKCV